MPQTHNYPARRTSLEATLKAFAKANWPGVIFDSDPDAQYIAKATYPRAEGSYEFWLFVNPFVDGTKRVKLDATQIRVDAVFHNIADTDDYSVIFNRADEMGALLMTQLQATVPAEWARASTEDSATQDHVLNVAHAAALAVGNYSAFGLMIEMGDWEGRIKHGNVELEVRLHLPQGLNTNGYQGYLRIEAILPPDQVGKIGSVPAQDFINGAIAEIHDNYKQRLLALSQSTTSAFVTRAAVESTSEQLPAPFYTVTAVIDDVLKSIGGTDAWIDGGRARIRTVDTNTRAITKVNAKNTDNGGLELTTTIELQRAEGLEITESELAAWKNAANAVTAEVAAQLERYSAPAFSVSAPVEAVRSLMRKKLAQTFPSDKVQDYDQGLQVSSFTLGENVFGRINAVIEETNEWETRITLTGDIYGQGVPAEPRALQAARLQFRAEVARAARQLRTELIAELGPPHSGRPDIGLG